MIEAVIFDWGGTLAPWVPMDHLLGWRMYAEALYPSDQDSSQRVATALLAAEQRRWSRVLTEHRAFRLDQVIDDADVALAEVGGPRVASTPDALAAFREAWLVITHTRPEVTPMLGQLREQGLVLGVLSSTAWPGHWHEDYLRRDGVLHLFDGCVWSSDLDWTKPHPEAFAAALASVGVSDPGRCVYVGDRIYDDIHGAQQFGMRTVFVPHSVIPPDQLVPVDAKPDAVLDTLSDLPEIIASW